MRLRTAIHHHCRRRHGLAGWFVRRSPADSAGVLSPSATAGLLLALLVVVSLSIRSVAAGAGPITVTAPVGNTGQRPPTDDTWAPPSAPVTLAFGGDVQFENWLAEAVRADPHATLAPLAGLLGDADMAVVNLETAVTDRGTPAPKAYTFRAPEQGLTALRSAGVDVVSIANNHGMDFGHQGLIDTQRSVRAAGLGLIGGGRDAAEAFRPHVATIHGRRVAVLGATQVLDAYATTAWAAGADRPGLASAKAEGDGLPRLIDAVRRAAAHADTVVVMLHWGREKEQCPLPRQQRLVEQLRVAGADIIVGGHAHLLAGGGYLGDAIVHYGLGNLVVAVARGPATTSGVLMVTIAPDDRTSIAWRPAVLRDGVASAVNGSGASSATRAWEDLRGCTDLRADPASAA
jgi:poly-gamma-glutamate synthesis protein (capsule biosynthesis protein)